MSDIIAAFRDAMRANGVDVRGDVIADGKLHRAYVEGDRRGTRNGWYILHASDATPAGAYGSMRGGDKMRWSMKGSKPLTREERAALKAKIDADKARRAGIEAEQRATAADAANRVWNAAKDAENTHAYLRRKQVASYGLKMATWVREYGHDAVTGEIREHRIASALLVPIRNSRREIVSLQAIFPNDKNALKRDKDFLAGGEKRGCFFAIGKPGQVDGKTVLVLCEGYATGASVHAATGLGVIVVFDAGNILPVAETVRRLMPAAVIIVAADDDRWTDKNTGVTYATAAAKAVGARVVVPVFRDVATKPTDLNDLQVLEGADEVRRQVLAGLARPSDVAPPVPVEPDLPEPPPHDDIPPGPQGDEPEPAPAIPARAETQKPRPAPAAAAGKDDDDAGPTDVGGYFTILGHDRDRIYVYQHEKKMVSARGESSWDKNALMAIAPLQWWEMHFQGDKGLNKDAAVNWLIRTAFKRGFYDPSMSRGRGAWLDESRIVYHFGHMLTVDGEQTDVTGIKSRYVYEQGKNLPLPSDTPMTDAEGRVIFDAAKRFRWTRPASALLLAGWCAIAPICGALRWRPHIWVTGGPGSGKSTILNDYIHFLMAGSAIYAQGNSTEAGIRQTLRNDALPVLFDESEQNNEREQNRMQSVLSLIRQSSTESEAKTLKGTTGGTAMDFMIRSIFCLSSIQVGIKHQADYERIAILALRPKRDSDDESGDWQVLKKMLAEMRRDRALPSRLVRRSLNLLPTTVKNIDIFAEAAAARFGSQREGDQYGALLAGAWSLVSTRLATLAEAEAMIDRYDWSEYLEHAESEESTKALSTLMGAPIRLPRGETVTVHELACRAAGRPVETVDTAPNVAESILRRHGMAVVFNGAGAEHADLLVSYNSAELYKLLDGTAYAADLKGQLLRVAGARRYEKPVSFNGVKDRCVAIPMSVVMGDDRPARPPVYEPGDDDVPF